MLPLAGLRMTSVVRTEGNGAHTGVQRHGLIIGRLQSRSRLGTNRPLFIGHLLQTLLELLALPLPRLGFDLLFYRQQAELDRGTQAASVSQADAARNVWSRWRNCRCSG